MNKNSEEYLDDYIRRMTPVFSGVSERSGHTIASMLIGYRSGLYDRTIESGKKALLTLENKKAPKILLRAVSIVIDSAVLLSPSQKSIRSEFDWEGEDPLKSAVPDSQAKSCGCLFDESEKDFLAIEMNDKNLKVPDEFSLDNALIMCYAAAYTSSPYDHIPLIEQVMGHLIRRIEHYNE
ncbi:hypothetical protein F1737_10730 [Methanoplanus sp. FWC-SCC4]|uniref:Uncharacterized protein n=1 Tax=Methanochimaera problematica TaxID=2609417 RepID=A0AA97FEK9_9EURY|nr:hypothetical protein [Methanoplanus sp. FWC-SCC4]WOF17117.1 hypothetical protein F1737_10730 [Methanoplanus sp. FWC-SCC4]